MAALSENMLTVSMLLSVSFLPGVFGKCGHSTPTVFITTTNTEALSGSCLQVQCNFTAQNGKKKFDSQINTTGAWIQSNNNIFDINKGVRTNSVNITGNMSQKNCTTVFSDIKTSQADSYFLRIENGEYTATACSKPLQITVKDSPWSPIINISAGDLKENQSVTITCSALTPCPHSPPELTWNLQQDSQSQTDKNTDGTFTTKIQETITLSDTHDGYKIRCSAAYPVNGGIKTAEREVTLSVSYAPKDTSASISPSGLVSAGSWVKLSCSSRAKPPPSFTWFRNSKHGAISVSVGPVYSFNATEGGEYYCVATNDLGNQRSSHVLISIAETENLEFLIPLLAVIVFIVIICLLISVWWFKFKHPSSQPTQTQRDEGIYVEMSAKKPEQELHYEEVTIREMKPEATSVSPQEDTVYAQVKVADAGNSSAHTTSSPEDLYAQVKRK